MAAHHPRTAHFPPLRLAFRHRRPSAEAPPTVRERMDTHGQPRVIKHHGYRGALIFAGLMAGLAALVWGASTGTLQAVGGALDWLRVHDTTQGRALTTVLAATAAALALIGAWGRETAERRPVRLAGGRARMAVDEVAAALRDAILDDAGIADAGVRVRNLHRRGRRVAVRADIHPRARIVDTLDGVDAVVREIVQRQMGVRLAARPAVDVRYQELDLRLGRDT